jgi:hypothetical protein
MAATEVRVVPFRLSRSPGVQALGLYTTGVLAGTSTYVMRNDGRTILHLIKAGAGTTVLTVRAVGTIRGQKAADETWSVVGATGILYVGPFEVALFNDAYGDMRFDFSTDITTLTWIPLSMS